MHPRRSPFSSTRRRDMAEREVALVLNLLPLPLRDRARDVVVLFFDRPAPEWLDEGFEEDLLGLFEGETTDASCFDGFQMHPQISLFVENIWDFAEGDPQVFREEIRRTYLHELGHFLGLGEEDLRLRGLE